MVTSTSSDMTAPRSWSEVLGVATCVRVAVLVALMFAVYWGTVRHTLISRWSADATWSHCWLIPVFSLYFLATRREALLRACVRPSYLGAVILGVSLSAYFFFSWQLPMAYPRGLTIVGAIFGLTLLMGGWGVMRIAWFPILFLLFAIPLPDRLYVSLTMPLREFASTAAAMLMPLFAADLQTEAQAVVIDYVRPGMPPGTLNVEEACSGMRSLMIVVAIGVAMTYLEERPPWQRAILVLSCAPVAILCNVIRVTTTGLLYIYGHDELARGVPHLVLGLVMFAIALGLFMIIGTLLDRLFVEEPADR